MPVKHDNDFLEAPSASSLAAEPLRSSFYIGLIGYALFIAWVVCLAFPPTASLTQAEDIDISYFVFFAIAILFLLFFLFNSRNFTSAKSLFIIVGVFVVSLTLSNLLPGSVLQTGFLALSFVSLSMLWGIGVLITLSHHELILITMGAAALGGLFSIMTSYLELTAAQFFTIILPLISITLFVVAYRDYAKSSLLANDTSYQHGLGLSVRSPLTTIISGFAIGFGSYYLSFSSGQLKALTLAGICVFATGLLLSINVMKKSQEYLREETLLKFIAPVIILALVPLTFLDGNLRWLCAVALIFGFAIHIFFAINATAESIRFNQLPPGRTFSLGVGVILIGIFIGWGLATLSNGVLAENQNWILFGIVVLIATASSFLFRDNYPNETDTGFSVADLSQSTTTGFWKRRIEVVALEYDLTNRQKEVLALLAKGRNAIYIQKRFYISLGTAKSHIYSIYQKLGVHSRQELIDLVEKVELDNDD